MSEFGGVMEHFCILTVTVGLPAFVNTQRTIHLKQRVSLCIDYIRKIDKI